MSDQDNTTKRRGLGMGLSALLGSDDDLAEPAPSKQPARIVPIEQLAPSAIQPRKQFDDEELDSLADSLRRHGLLQPILVRPDNAGQFEIVAGERRWRAAQRAGLHEIAVVVKEMDDRTLIEMALIENLQREDLSPFEEAEAYQNLAQTYGYSHEQIGEAVGKSRPHIANAVRLLNLPKEVRQMIEAGALSAGHGRALLSAREPIAMAKRAVAEGLNVRDIEKLVKAEQLAPKERSAPLPPDPNITSLEQELAHQLGLKVTIAPKRKGGTITFRYSDMDQLDGLISRLRSRAYMTSSV